MTSEIGKQDPEVFEALAKEELRQKQGLEMIASENYVSPAVLEAQGSLFTNKYAEGYPRHRYYSGCENVDAIEQLAIDRLKKIFSSDHANVQPHSGSQANMAVYFSILKPGDPILGMDLSHGGHLTHGAPVNFSGFLFKAHFYGLSEKTNRIDYNQIEELAQKIKPKLIIAGHSAYPRLLDFEKFSQIAKKAGCPLMVDMAHISGLCAAGEHPSPLPHADFVTSTTHKTLRGPRGGIILCKNEWAKKIDSKIFPGIQGGPLPHVICAKAVAFKEIQQNFYKKYIQQVVKNARHLAQALSSKGYELVTGGTDNHLILVDLTNKQQTGKDIALALDLAGITVNKNTIPRDPRSPFVTSGIRLGAPALTTRGMKEKEMDSIASWVDQAILNSRDEEKLSKIKNEVRDFCSNYPLFKTD